MSKPSQMLTGSNNSPMEASPCPHSLSGVWGALICLALVLVVTTAFGEVTLNSLKLRSANTLGQFSPVNQLND